MSNCMCQFFDYQIVGEPQPTQNGIKFAAVEAERSGPIPDKEYFAAFDEIAEQIKRMKVTDKSRVNIMAEKCVYASRNGDGRIQKSYKIVWIHYVSKSLKPETAKQETPKPISLEDEDLHPFN